MNWCGDGSAWGWWWMVPLIGIALCIVMCRLFRSSAAGSRFCCGSGTRDGRHDELREEIGKLREEIGKIKEGRR
ncbi:MAG: hypothetical protein ACYDAA_00030 [Syntrophales bacterium]